MFGYHGRILRVDLTAGEVRQETYEADFARKYLGGNGFAARLVCDLTGPGIGGLDRRNAVVFAVGPLTDTPVWGSSRGHVAGISPLTGLFVDSNFGGDFASAQKRTGFDAICITGKSGAPVYLEVTETGGRLVDAAGLWGGTTEETNEALRKRMGQAAVAASIGPAGENQVAFANIVCGGARPGAAGRGGLGAVLGAKNLKAVVAAGQLRTEINHGEALKAFLRDRLEQLRSGTELLTKTGTPFLVEMIQNRGLLCTHNASQEVFEHWRDISAAAIQPHVVRNVACRRCPVACGKKVIAPSGDYAGRTLKMPEYETLYALGSMLDNRDLASILNANGICDLFGMDTVSLGVTMAFAAECLERGIVSESDLGGTVRFEDGPGMVELCKATVMKQGVGRHLAMGSQALAEQFGPEARELLYAARGMEIPGHSARGLRPMAVGYATGTRGGSHHDTRPKYLAPEQDPGFDGQVQHSIQAQNFTAVGDSLVLCRFVEERGFGSTNNQDVAEVLRLVTGWDIDADELETIGERIVNLERMMQVSRGVRREQDAIPWRAMNEPIPAGPAKGRHCRKEELDAMLDEYYRLRGWSSEGIPREKKLAELGLGQDTCA